MRGHASLRRLRFLLAPTCVPANMQRWLPMTGTLAWPGSGSRLVAVMAHAGCETDRRSKADFSVSVTGRGELA